MLNLESAILRHPSVVSSDTIVLSAIKQMNGIKDSTQGDHPSSYVVVLAAEKVLGVFTERDVVRLVSQQQPIERLTLGEVLTHPPVTLPESALEDLATTIDWLERQQITHLPIVNEQQQLTGIATYDSLQKLQAERTRPALDSQPTGGFNYASLVAASPVGILHTNPEGICTYANDRYCEIMGIEPDTLMWQPWYSGYRPEDLERITQEFEQALCENRPMRIEYRIQRPDGTERWVFGQSVVERDAVGQPIGYVGTITDISDRKRTEFLLASQNTILEQIAKAEPIREILTNLLQAIENYIPGAFCSIMLCRDEWLCDTVAPSLPQEYVALISQIPIEDGAGSCGTAVYRREVVIVKDIEQDPLWQDYKHLALPYGLRACWSSPIFGSDQNLLGVFAVYYTQPQEPSLTEIETLRKAANLAGIAIERDRSAQALQQLNKELEHRIQQRTQELQEREQFLQTVLDTFPLSVFWKDRNSVYLGCNQNFLRDANGTSAADVIGKTDHEMPWGQTEAELYRQDDRTVITTEIAKLSIVETQCRADGQRIWLETNKLPLRNLQGEVIGILGTYQDITDRKIAELALAESQAKFWRMTENVPGMIYRYVLHPDGTDQLTYVSSRVREIFELEPETTILDSSQMWARVHPDDVSWLRMAIQTSAETLQPFITEHRLILPQQGLRWVQNIASANRLNNGDVVWDGVVIDRTASKQAEQQLQLVTERLELALSGALIGIWEWTLADGKLIWDDRMFALYGLEAADFSGRYENWLQLIHPDDRSRMQRVKSPSIQLEEQAFNEFRIVLPDGTVRFIYSHAFNQINEQGEIVKTIGLNIDITDRKTAELQLQQTNEELIRATRLKDEFLANMSHELRTPLNAILGMTEGLTEQVFGAVNDRQRKALATIERSGSHLLELINDILDVSKIESGHLELDCQPTGVVMICQSSLTFVKQQAHTKRITLETKLPPNLPDLMVEERRIRQVVINLLNNAVKFTPAGGKITVEVENKRSGFLGISITDTGIGISPENIKKLFQPFIQIDSALNRQYDGTGLGLALVKRVVELHGGSVSLTSEVGVGSCFSIELPCVDAVPAMQMEPPTSGDLTSEAVPGEVAATTSPLILLAEDNSANISTISSYLEAKGYRLVIANNGQEAVDLVQSARPDLVLMDIQMPGMDGIEAMQEIRRHRQSTDLPIVALTALAMAGDRERCIAAGANDYISKPIKLKHLSQTIQSILVDRSANPLN